MGHITRSLCETLGVFGVDGIARRWNAIQEHLHPLLEDLSEQVRAALARRFPRQSTLYEVSFKSQRYINRGQGLRAPVDEYHVAFDRPPRGSGILVSVSGAERAVLVGLQLWGVRKPALHQLWNTARSLWLPLVEQIEQEGQARFVRPHSFRGGRRATASSVQEQAEMSYSWLDVYLYSRSASYLWAGFVYPWERLPDNLDERLIAHILDLFPLNEALMEQAEMGESGAAGISESPERYCFSPPVQPVETIVEHIRSHSFVISDTIIRAYHVALHTRPLAILAGISGTGKTRLTRLYADAIHRIPSPAHENPYYLLVAVQPDWHSAKDLPGYYNALTGLFHPTPFLRFLLRATADPQQPYFVCFDEMNLARPEYYLAPLLSALETTEHTIDLGTPAEDVTTVTGETLRNPFRLPLNVRMTGTVNVDESTYALSDKLLDRANVIELTEVDLETFRKTYPEPIDDRVWSVVVQVYAVMARVGQPFGYRTITEMVRYIEQAEGVFPPAQALDLQIKQRILPKLRGEESPHLRRALSDLLLLLESSSEDTFSCPQSAAKVRRMLERLDTDGFTDFYE
jgi:hypothetical protein